MKKPEVQEHEVWIYWAWQDGGVNQRNHPIQSVEKARYMILMTVYSMDVFFKKKCSDVVYSGWLVSLNRFFSV